MTAEALCIVSAFILGIMLGAVAGVLVYAIAKAAKDPVMIRREDERPRRMW